MRGGSFRGPKVKSNFGTSAHKAEKNKYTNMNLENLYAKAQRKENRINYPQYLQLPHIKENSYYVTKNPKMTNEQHKQIFNKFYNSLVKKAESNAVGQAKKLELIKKAIAEKKPSQQFLGGL